MRRWMQGCICSGQTVRCVCGHKPEARLITARPIKPGQAEVARNPRAASAKLRVAEKLPAGGSPT